MDVQDSPLRFLKRNLNVKRVTHLVKRGYNSIKNEGLEATQRKVQFRVNLMLKRDVWQFRSDIPLKRELKEQSITKFEFMPKISIVVPLYNTPKKFLLEMVESVEKQSYSNWQLV
ncbi:MAG: glycosyltransferase family 2 protein, partial [Oscillospiraceae bacterium]|nr:glycosyltransferase family 2 protein [Oscillospiraceae bacterium]